MASGYANAFMSGSFTVDVVGPALGPAWIGYVLATRNLTGLVSGIVLGRLSDYIGRFQCYLIALTCEGMTRRQRRCHTSSCSFIQLR